MKTRRSFIGRALAAVGALFVMPLPAKAATATTSRAPFSLFMVKLTANGGTTSPSFTYDVYDEGRKVGEAMQPIFRTGWPNVSPAEIGMAFRDETGGLALFDAKEIVKTQSL